MPEILALLLMIAALAFLRRFLRDEKPAPPEAPAATPKTAAPLPKPVPLPKKKTKKQRKAEKQAAPKLAVNANAAAPSPPAVIAKVPPPPPVVIAKAPPTAKIAKAPPPLAPPPAPKAPPPPAKAKPVAAKKSKPKEAKAPSDPSLIKGTCIEVVDGDTLIYRDDHRRIRKLRLKGIDSPEYRPLQDHGAEAKMALAGKVDGRRIEVRVLELDMHGRELGIVFHLGRNVNEELVAEGHAWNFAYRSDPLHPRLDSLERQAKLGRKGLWQGQRPIHPKDFRARNRF